MDADGGFIDMLMGMGGMGSASPRGGADGLLLGDGSGGLLEYKDVQLRLKLKLHLVGSAASASPSSSASASGGVCVVHTSFSKIC